MWLNERDFGAYYRYPSMHLHMEQTNFFSRTTCGLKSCMIMKSDQKQVDSTDNLDDAKEKENEIKSNILPMFWDLASLEDKKRNKCVVNLVETLAKETVNNVQQQHQEVNSDDIQPKSTRSNKEYTLQRLVKGLSSSRKGARQGYATALVHLLTQFEEIDLNKVFDLMNEHLLVKQSFKSQEERDAYFGQVFCLAAIYKAIYQRSQKQDENSSWISKAVEGLLGLMKKKSFLEEICANVVVDILNEMDADSFTKDILPLIEGVLKKGWEHCSPDELQILLAVERLFKESIGKTFFKTHWGHSNVCNKENFEKMSLVLMNSTITAHPRVHAVWKEVLLNVMKSNKSFKTFWNTVVEEGLMQSSHERKFLAIQVLQDMLQIANKSQVEVMFSNRLVKSIINGCSSDKNYLHTTAKKLLSSIPSHVSKNPNEGIALAVVNQLVGRKGNFQFDMITKSKTVESLISLLDSASIHEFFDWLKGVYISGKDNDDEDPSDSDEDSISMRRKWVLTQLHMITKNSHAKKEENLLNEVANFLFFHAYFRVAKKKKNMPEAYCSPDPPVEEKVVNACRERFIGVLSEVSNCPASQQGGAYEHAKKGIVGTTKDGDFYAYHLVKFAKTLLDDLKHVALNKTWSPKAMDAFTAAFTVIEEIRSLVARDGAMSESRGFELIFLHSCLQMFDNTEEAADIIQELLECYKQVSEKKKKRKFEELHWSEVLTEILISFLAQSSSLMRNVVNLVFSMILPHVTPTAFNLIIEALRPKKNPGEDGLELVHDSDAGIESSDDEEMDSDDAEAASADDATSDKESDEESEDDSVDDSDDDSDDDSVEDSENGEDDDDIDEGLRKEVKSALGDAAANDSSDDSDEDELSDIDMDSVDPVLLNNMDNALASAFKSRSQAKCLKKDDKVKKKAILHFRLRVLDVVETFVKRQPKSGLLLDLLEPLLEIIKSSRGNKEERVMLERAQGLLKNKICRSREVPDHSDVDKESIHDQLFRLVEDARKAPSFEIVNLITQACMFLIRILRGKEDAKEDPSLWKTKGQRKRKCEEPTCCSTIAEDTNDGMMDVEKVVSIFNAALADFMLRKTSHLQSVLFLELIKQCPAVAWRMAADIPTYFSKAVNNFRKVQACEMLLQLLAIKTKGSEKYFENLIAPLVEELTLIFQAACEDKCSFKARHLHEFVKLLDKFIKEGNRNDEVFSAVKVNKILETLEAAVEGPVISRSNQLVAYCKRLVSSSKEPTQNGKSGKKKRKESKNLKEAAAAEQTDNIDQATNSTSKPKSKKKKRKNTDN